jgi:hypothetical protein
MSKYVKPRAGGSIGITMCFLLSRCMYRALCIIYYLFTCFYSCVAVLYEAVLVAMARRLKRLPLEFMQRTIGCSCKVFDKTVQYL